MIEALSKHTYNLQLQQDKIAFAQSITNTSDVMMRLLLLALLLFSATCAFAQNDSTERESNPPAVDIELILAVDVSFSMDKGKLAIRREGYAEALVSKEFLEALKAGPHGKLAVTYFEWSASGYQKVVVPWRVIDSPETAAAVAGEIMKSPNVLQSRTSISGAINFAMSLFDKSPYRGSRRVIDISGDGPNNSGEPVEGARDAALAKGVTINGLPMMMGEPPRTRVDIDDLDLYYEDCVTGGPGSFVMTVKDPDKLKGAIRTMLILEVTGRAPEQQNIPSPRAVAGDRGKRTSCMKGEQAYDAAWGKPSGRLPLPGPSKASGFTAWQHSEFVAHTKKCFLRQKEPIRNRVELSTTIGPDGMIIGDPEVTSPIDSDAFRRDVTAVLKKLHQCEPFIVDPFGRIRVRFTQTFEFEPEGSGKSVETVNAAIQANFKKCWSASRTGPTIWVLLSYKPDGTYASSPNLINPEKTAEYSRAADQVMRQITKCPPVKFPNGKKPEQSVRWQFPSHESANASRRK